MIGHPCQLFKLRHRPIILGKNKNSKFVTKYSDSMTRLADVNLSSDQSSELKEIPLPSLSISKSRSMSDVRESGFKRRAKQVQATAAVSQAFRSSGNQKSLQRWKELLQ